MTPEELNKMIKERERKVEDGIVQLQQIVKKYPLNEFLLLLAALNWPGNNASNYLDKKIGNNKSTGLKYQIYIPALAKYAILNSNDFIGSSAIPFEIAFEDVVKCITLINDIKDFVPFELASDFDFALSAFHFFIANQHFRFQDRIHVLNNTIARAFIIFRDLPKKTYPSLELSKIFKIIYGLNQSKFFVISARLLGMRQKDWFNFDNFSGLDKMGNNLTKEDLITYFARMSINYNDFRNEAIDQNKSFIGKSSQLYGYSPFDKYPILKRKDKFLIISQHYLIWRVYLPIYFDFLQYFTELENSQNNTFSNSFGHVFQDYVGILLKQLKDGSNLLDEIKFGKSKKDFTDWSLLYPKKKSIILIEVKKHLLPLKSKFSMDKRILEQSLNDTIIKGLVQIYNKINSINNKEKGLEKLESYESFYPVVISFDDSYLLNDYFIRKIIDGELSKRNIKFQNKWQIITIKELEQIIPSFSYSNTFLEMLRLKSEDKYVYSDWDKYLIDSGFEIKTNEYLGSIIKGELN
ncbi:MAG: hypothetical protein ACXAC2_08355 [Candidatus Kariarchaeaceae archaeon]|jgi:hypothetical protein